MRYSAKNHAVTLQIALSQVSKLKTRGQCGNQLKS